MLNNFLKGILLCASAVDAKSARTAHKSTALLRDISGLTESIELARIAQFFAHLYTFDNWRYSLSISSLFKGFADKLLGKVKSQCVNRTIVLWFTQY